MTIGFKKITLPFHLSKRAGLSQKKYWLLRVGGILLAFLAAGVVCSILKPGSFGNFYAELVRGCFDFSDLGTIIDLLVEFSILLLISVILILPFKMRFWNIGAEGQILVGALAAAGVARFAPSTLPNAVILILCLLSAQAAGTIWALIPALFKALFKTNETLFTLMMNYIAAVLSDMMISIWVKDGSQKFGMLRQGIFPSILGDRGTLIIIIAAAIFIGLFFYVNKGKHGYEISVIGESIDTARYVGIDVKKVTIRTLAVAGMLFGVVGFLIVCGENRSFNSTIVAGRGFTGVLIAWLGHFNPLQVLLFAFLAAVMKRGTFTAASSMGMSSSQFTAICTGVFFFFIIACEFLSTYQIKIDHRRQKKEELT